jgi:type I restriction enzyme, R subunit
MAPIPAHMAAYFKDVVYRYESERAVREGFLVGYDVVNVHSDVRVNGVFLSETEQVGPIDFEFRTEQFDVLEDERHGDKSHFVVFDCFTGTLLE